MRRLFILLIGLLNILPVAAHEMRPGYLEITEFTADTFAVLWKVPMRGDMTLKIEPRLPESCREQTPPASYPMSGAMIQRWSVVCEGGLTGQHVSIVGLKTTLTDVLVQLARLDGTTHTTRLQPTDPSFVVPAEPSRTEIAATYLGLGVEHILRGVDHLLFVLALLLIVKGWRRLVGTITAFTIAHSVTLAAATLGYVHVPQQPVEAVIALSILFLATEIIHGTRGRAGMAERWPWVVAFIFGLLHGFGFAGALAEVGLPEQAIPLALLFFNVGVELGQLVFVAVVLATAWVARNVQVVPIRQTLVVMTYGIGGVAAFWTIERVAGFWV